MWSCLWSGVIGIYIVLHTAAFWEDKSKGLDGDGLHVRLNIIQHWNHGDTDGISAEEEP